MPDRHAQRQKRAARYTRLVGMVKVLLPLAALVILSTVFLLGEDDGFDRTLVFTEADFNALGDPNTLTRARFAGATMQGDYLSFSTARVAPDPARENVLEFSRLSGSARFVSGQEAQLIAPVALYFITDNRITMPEGGALSTSDGYRGRMATMEAELSNGRIAGTELEGSGPLGAITAGRFELRQTDSENRVLWFGDGVRLVLNQRVNETVEGSPQ